MEIRELLNKDTLTSKDKDMIVDFICEEEKRLEGIEFSIINFPKEKQRFKLIRRKEDVTTLGFQKTILGFMENTYEVAFNQDKIENKLVTLLTTIYHELCHVKQKTKCTSLRYPLVITSIFSKELVITAARKSYYKSNYDSMYGEIDARVVGRDKTIRLLDRYNPLLADEKRSDFKARNSIDKALGKLYIHKSGNDLDLGEVLISKKVDKIIGSNPEFMDSTPSLVFEYDNKGRRKDLKTLYEMEPYYLKDKNNGQKLLISSAIDEFMFIYLMIYKEDSIIDFYHSCGKEGLKRLEVALKHKLDNLKERKLYSKKLYECTYFDKQDHLSYAILLDEYTDLLNTYLKLIGKLYISRQSKVK